MNVKLTQIVVAVLTVAAVVAVIVLVALGRVVPAPLYAFAGLGLGGHLALLPVASASPPAAAPSGSGSSGVAQSSAPGGAAGAA